MCAQGLTPSEELERQCAKTLPVLKFLTRQQKLGLARAPLPALDRGATAELTRPLKHPRAGLARAS